MLFELLVLLWQQLKKNVLVVSIVRKADFPFLGVDVQVLDVLHGFQRRDSQCARHFSIRSVAQR
jgi:hypothetical protein